MLTAFLKFIGVPFNSLETRALTLSLIYLEYGGSRNRSFSGRTGFRKKEKYEIFNINSFFRKAGNLLGTYYVPAVLVYYLNPHNTLPSSHHRPDVNRRRN